MFGLIGEQRHEPSPRAAGSPREWSRRSPGALTAFGLAIGIAGYAGWGMYPTPM
jgi:hypothetical protein